MKIARITLMLLLITFQINGQEKWVNAIGNQSCYPHTYFEPRNLEELSHQIKHSALEGDRIRAVGTGYSISDIGCTEGCLLNLKHLNKMLSVNLADRTVRVEAGITLQDLNEQLAEYNLALSNQAAISEISLGGALSTGVHGTGHTGSLSSFVKEFELVTANGSLNKISLDSDAEAFFAVSVGLGSLGVIYAVTLQCEPLFYLRKSEEVVDLDSIIRNYSQIHDSNDFFQFLWNPTGKVLVNRWNRCDQVASLNLKTAVQGDKVMQDFESESLAMGVDHSLRVKATPIASDYGSKDCVNLSPSTAVFRLNHAIVECVPSYEALSWYYIDESDRDLFSEIAIPVSALPEAVKAIQGFVQKHKSSGAQIIDINVRFVEQDKHAYLSPSSDGPVVYLAFCILEEDKYLAIYKEFEELMSKYNGRPHWGKLNFLKYENVKKLYGDNLQKFINVKQRLDPQETFSNSFSDRILKGEKQ